jgi:hypothetical protein
MLEINGKTIIVKAIFFSVLFILNHIICVNQTQL